MRAVSFFRFSFGRAGMLVLAFVSIAVAAEKGAKTRPPEATLATLAGAETQVFRALTPEPLRLHVFKPANWTPTDRRVAFVWFFEPERQGNIGNISRPA